MKTVYKQEDFDKFEIIDGIKQCPPGIYEDIKNFNEKCSFGEDSSFGENSSFVEGSLFGKGCSFKEGCSFGGGCSFAGWCIFLRNCSFGDSCSFSGIDAFGEGCSFGKRCSFGRICLFKRNIFFGEKCVFGERSTFESKIIIEGKYTLKSFISIDRIGPDKLKVNFYNCEEGQFVRYELGYEFGNEDGCITLEEFENKIKKIYKDKPQYLKEYTGAINYIKSLNDDIS